MGTPVPSGNGHPPSQWAHGSKVDVRHEGPFSQSAAVGGAGLEGARGTSTVTSVP